MTMSQDCAMKMTWFKYETRQWVKVIMTIGALVGGLSLSGCAGGHATRPGELAPDYYQSQDNPMRD